MYCLGVKKKLNRIPKLRRWKCWIHVFFKIIQEICAMGNVDLPGASLKRKVHPTNDKTQRAAIIEPPPTVDSVVVEIMSSEEENNADADDISTTSE